MKELGRELYEESEKIRIENIDYRIESSKILNQVSLKVLKNQIVGVIGPNGSGKTTLLKHIYRVLPVQEKTVYINGIDIHNYSYRESAKNMTVMRQENSSQFDYSILDIVLMGRTPYKHFFTPDTKKDIEIARNALDEVGMGAYAARAYQSLSGGEKQRVLIARSLAQETDILILDEPTNHLDVHYQWALMDTIKKVGKTVISVFHELNLACAYCGYLYVIDKGSIVSHGLSGDICTPEMLREVFRISADVIKNQDGRPHIIYKGAVL